jgi:plasmid stabilization system protein ParE
MAARRLEFSRRARADLQQIAAYIAAHAGREVAGRFILDLENECLRLLVAPGMGKPYPFRPGIRKLNLGNYKIIYRANDLSVLILRIWDGRRGTEPKF